MRYITLLIKKQRQRQVTLRHWDLIWPTKRQIQNFLRQPQRETWEPCNRKNNFEPNLIPKRPNWTNPNKSVQQGLQCLNHGRTVCVCVCVCVHCSHRQLHNCLPSTVSCCSVLHLLLLCKYAPSYNWASSLPQLWSCHRWKSSNWKIQS